MKKILSTVAALGMVAAFAGTAVAADAPAGMDFSVKGYYLLQGKNIGNSNDGVGVAFVESGTDDGNSKSWWEHDLRLFPTLKVNDKITLKSDVRLASSKVWYGSDSSTSNGNDISVHRAYMEYASPIGTIRTGLVDAGAWGGPYMNSVEGGYRFMVMPNFMPAPFSLTLFTQKIVENDAAVGTNNTGMTDQDTDSYYAGVGYKMDMGDIAAAYYGVRSEAQAGSPALMANNYWFNANLKVGIASIYAELGHKAGEFSATMDYDAWAGILLASAKATDALTVTGAYFFATGEDTGTDKAQYMGATGTGKDFEPLYIMTGDDMGVLNGDGVNAAAGIQAAGVQAFGLFADFAVSPALTLHAGIGTGKADEVQTAGQDDDYGWEYDLGASYKLLDNLTYDLHFGYWAVGDFVKGGVASVVPNDVTVVTNSLKMTF